LFEADGYKKLTQALRMRADTVRAMLQIIKSSSLNRKSIGKEGESKRKKAIRFPNKSSKNIVGLIVFFILIFVSIFGLSPLLGQLANLIPTTANTLSPTSIVGDWLIDYDWDCNGSSDNFTLTLIADTSWSSSQGFSGFWNLQGNNIKLVFDDENTTYIGTVTGDEIIGTMTTTYTDKRNGFWGAQRR